MGTTQVLQMALMASLVSSSADCDSFRADLRSIQRRRLPSKEMIETQEEEIIQTLLENGWISSEEHDELVLEPTRIHLKPKPANCATKSCTEPASSQGYFARISLGSQAHLPHYIQFYFCKPDCCDKNQHLVEI